MITRSLFFVLLIGSVPCFAQKPTITSFAPTSGPVGTSVIITGTNFSSTPANNIVYFGALRATVSASTATQLTVTVSAGATYNTIIVLTNGLQAYSNKPFTVTFASDGTIDAGFYAPQVEFQSATAAEAIATGDLDGDGKLDIVTSYQAIKIMLNTSTGPGVMSYTTSSGPAAGSNPRSLAIGDLDGDGKPDLVVGNFSSNTISIFRNISTIGSIAFESKGTVATGTNPWDVAIADFDSDGKMDLVSANYGAASISVFKSTSSGVGSFGFNTKVDFTTNASPGSLAITDADDDGKADVTVTYLVGSVVSALRNISTGGIINFDTKQDFASPANCHDIVSGDLDSDGKLDLATINTMGVYVFRNTSTTGTINYAAKADALIASVSTPLLTIGDLDGDGKVDLATISSGLSLLKNTSSPGSFSFSKFSYPLSGQALSMRSGDFDGDGKPDIGITTFNDVVAVFKCTTKPVVTSFTPTSGFIGASITITGKNFNADPARNTVYFGAVKAAITTATTSQLVVVVPPGATYQPISVTVDGLQATSAQPFTITFSDAATINVNSFSDKVDITLTKAPIFIAQGDFDHDGKVDLVSNPYVFRNTSTTGSIAFADRPDFSSSSLSSPVVADLDGDGEFDVATLTASDEVSVYRNLRTSPVTFTIDMQHFDVGPTTEDPASISISDIDGDGRPDMAVARPDADAIALFRNTSPGPATVDFAEPPLDVTGLTLIHWAHLADLDKDGKPDLIVANGNASGKISVYRNLSTIGTLSYPAKTDVAVGIGPVQVATADIDNDGKQDIIVLCNGPGTREISLLRNTTVGSTISFAKTAIAVTNSLNSLAVSDLNGDGKPDFAVAAGSSKITAFRNISTPGVISFDTGVDFLTGSSPGSLAIADFDLDGKPDFMTANTGVNSLSILRNAIAVTVAGFSPALGAPGAHITITGQNFSTINSNNIVKFNGVPTQVTLATNTTLTVDVPDGALTGKITVTSGNITGTSTNDFFAAPVITGFTPDHSIVGTPVTISGINFSTTLASNTVKFNGTTATVTASTATSITTSVPAGATNGKITVGVTTIAGTQTATSVDPFVVVADQPTSQPTSLSFGTVTSSSIDATFTAAAGSPSGYIVLQKEGSASTDVPTDGTTYVAGNSIGSSKVVSIGSTTGFGSASLISGGTYYYRIFSYNGSGPSINFRETTPLEGNKTTLVVEPTNQPSLIVFSEPTTSSIKASFAAPTPNVLGYIAIARTGQSPSEAPLVDGTTYVQGSAYGQSKVVYVGSQPVFTATSLLESTVYYFDIFAYNGSGVAINYLSVSPLEGNRTTLASEPATQATNVTLDNISTSSIRVSFTAAPGSPAGYLVLRKAGSASADVPVDGTNYSTAVGSTDVAQVGNTTTFNSSGLTAGTTYYFDVYSFNGIDQAVNYLTTSPARMSAVTLPPKPVALEAVNVLTNSFKAKWSETLSAGSYELDVSTSLAFDALLDGYAAKPVDALEYIVTGLLSDRTYYYRIRAKNSSGFSGYSDAISVTTAEDVTNAATTGTATDVNAIGAKLNGSFIPNGATTRVFFEYGPTTDLGTFTSEQTIDGTGSKNISAAITGLTDNSSYYFRITGSNTSGTSKGAIVPFTTAKVTATTGVASKIGLNSATLDGIVNTFGATVKVYFEYGLSTSPEKSTAEQTITTSQPQTITAAVDNLAEGADHYFRIVAVSTGGTLTGNNQPFTTVSPVDALSFSGSPSFSKQGDDYKLSVSLQKGSGTRTVKLSYAGIRAKTFTEVPVTSIANPYEVTLPSSKLDQLGLQFFFTASDGTVSNIRSETSYIYTPVSQLIPNLSPGGQPENYRIISIPVKMERNDPTTVFNSLMVKYDGYDINNWRFLTYEPGEPQGKNVDFGSIGQVEPGKGYWFNSVEKAEVTISGTTIQSNQHAVFGIDLKKGWNMIGDPYTFNIAWNDLLAFNADNKDIQAVGTKFYEYDAAKTSFKQSDHVTAWSGGFVKATAAVQNFMIPVTIGQSGSRVNAVDSEIGDRQLDQSEWFLPLRLTNGSAYNEMGGIGMHPDASVSNDRYDEQSLPRFQNYIELNSYHPEFFLPRFTRDVVPTQETYQWDYVIESNFPVSTTTLSWDSWSLGNNSAQLKLYDEEAAELIDMKKSNSYTIELEGPRKIKIFFSTGEKGFQPNTSGVGKPYPNPFNQSVTIPFFTGAETSYAQIAFYDLTGRKLKEVNYENLPPDFYYAAWDGSDDSGGRVAAGTYLYRFTTSDHKPVTGKVVVK